MQPITFAINVAMSEFTKLSIRDLFSCLWSRNFRTNDDEGGKLKTQTSVFISLHKWQLIFVTDVIKPGAIKM